MPCRLPSLPPMLGGWEKANGAGGLAAKPREQGWGLGDLGSVEKAGLGVCLPLPSPRVRARLPSPRACAAPEPSCACAATEPSCVRGSGALVCVRGSRALVRVWLPSPRACAAPEPSCACAATEPSCVRGPRGLVRAWLPSPSWPGPLSRAGGYVNSGKGCGCWPSHLLSHRSRVLFLVQGRWRTRDNALRNIKSFEKRVSS